MCQVAAVRAEVAFPSVMLTAAVLAQAEWNGNDIMFIQERRSQTQISVSKMLGCSRRKTRSRPGTGSPLLEHTLHHTAHVSLPSSLRTRAAHTTLRNPTQTDIHIYHTLHIHTNTYQRMPHITHAPPKNMSHKHISTHATMTAHTHAPHTYTHAHILLSPGAFLGDATA